MILICDNTKRKMRDQIRGRLLSEGIPCAVCHTDDIDRHLPAGVIVVTERYIADDVSYMADMHRPRSEIFIFGEDRPIYDFVSESYESTCKKRSLGEGYSHVSATDDGIVFCNRFIPMTKTEKRIVRMLMALPEWQSAEKIALYCLKDAGAEPAQVAVHICNLNKKAILSVGRGIIDCKRYLGYRISEFCLE